MDSEKIMAFLQANWQFVTLVVGIVLLMGAVRNWNWLCDPTEAPNAHRYDRGSRKGIFFLLGALLIVISIWSLILALR